MTNLTISHVLFPFLVCLFVFLGDTKTKEEDIDVANHEAVINNTVQPFIKEEVVDVPSVSTVLSPSKQSGNLMLKTVSDCATIKQKYSL